MRRVLSGLTSTVLVVAVAASCSSSSAPSAKASLAPVNAISAVLTVEAGSPVRLGATATAGRHVVRIPPPAKAATKYELPLVGLRADSSYDVAVDDVDQHLQFRTGPLPTDLPPIKLDVDRARSADGLTLLSLKPWAAPPPGTDPAKAVGGYLEAIDDEGYVVWYLRTDLGVLDARQLPNGDFLYTYDETGVRETDVLGRPVRELAGRIALDVAPKDLNGRQRATANAVRMDVDSAHHDVSQLDNGDFLLLTTELHKLTGPSQCGEAAAQITYSVIADVVAEVNPDTGAVVRKWPILDVFDPFKRPGGEFCAVGPDLAPPNFFYLGDKQRRDWTHANSVVLDKSRNALVVSLRHLSAVIAIRYAADATGPAGQLLWELGKDGTLPLKGEPTSYQHAAEVLDDGSVLVYDNGDAKKPPYSRAVIYEINDRSPNRADWSARQVWEHVLQDPDGKPVYTNFLGDVDMLPNGNILVTHGAIASKGGFNARVVEVDRARGDVVYDLRVGDAQHPWTVYRSQRLTTLTPQS